MGGVKLDGAGTQKMKTIEEALHAMATIHAMVERAAVEAKNHKPIGVIPQQIKRIATPLDRKSTRLNSSHMSESRMPSSA